MIRLPKFPTLIGGLLFTIMSGSVSRVFAQVPWAVQSSGTTSSLWGVAYGGGQFVAVGDGGTILTSPDGLAWTRRPSGTDKWLLAVAFGTDSYVAVGAAGVVLKSRDGTTWSPIAVAGATESWRLNGVAFTERSLAKFDDAFVACGENGLFVRGTYLDTSWSGSFQVAARGWLRGITLGGGVTVGQGGVFGISSAAVDLEAITRGPDRFVAVGQRGTVWTSVTGYDGWTTWSPPAAGDLFGVAYCNDRYVAVGAAGAIWERRDGGAAWSPATSGTKENLRAVASRPATLVAVAVGDGGMIVRAGVPVTGVPRILYQPAAAATRVGGTAGFKVLAGGAPPLSYQWSRDGQTITGATNDVLALTVVSAAEAGAYTVRVSAAPGSVTSDMAALTVGAAPAAPIVDARFRADQRLDAIPVNSNTQAESTTVIVPLPDGRVMLALSTTTRTRILRLLADGRIDPTFAEAGVNSGFARLALQPDGRLLVARWLGALNRASGDFFRLLADGSVDGSFSLPAASPAEGDGGLHRMLVQPDGKILVMTGAGRLLRLLADGNMDTGFQSPSGGSGFATNTGTAGDFTLLDNGSIYRAIPSDGLRRFLSTGQSDSAFGSPFLNPNLGSRAFRLFRDAGNRVLIDYETWVGSGGTSIAIETGSYQLLENGTLGGSLFGFTIVAPPAADGTLATRPSGYTVQSQPTDAPYLKLWSAYGRSELAVNWGIALPASTGSYVAAFGPDNGLWVGGDFSFYNGVASPRIVRLNRVTSEVSAAPVLLGTWPEAETVTAGQTITLRVAANSDGPVTYEWNLYGESEWVYTNAFALRRTMAPSLTVQVSGPGVWTWAVRARNSAGASAVAKGVNTAEPVRLLAIEPQFSRVSATEGRDVQLPMIVPNGVIVTKAEWRRDGVLLPPNPAGAWFPIYYLKSVTVADAGTYTVRITTSDGQQVTSSPIVVTVGDSSRFANLSVRARVGTGEQTAVLGFAIPPGGLRGLLVRGIGPALGAFGVTDVLADPFLELYDSSGRRMHANDDWSELTSVFDRVGAFRLAVGSKDAAFVTSSFSSVADSPLVAGNYTVHLSGSLAGTGTGLLEIYEADNVSERLTNMSARVFAGAGTAAAIAGFTIAGPVSKRVLLRAAGPALGTFGVAGFLADPRFEVRDAAGRLIAANDDWQRQNDAAAVATAAAGVGAFAFTTGSSDAALVASLPAGNYSVVVSGADEKSGVVLIELYELP